MRILFLDDAVLRHGVFGRAHGGDDIGHVFTAAAATGALEPFDLVQLDHDLLPGAP